MILYGWYDMHECDYDIVKRDFEDSEDDPLLFDSKGELSHSHWEHPLGKSRWFSSFESAKENALSRLELILECCQNAITEVSKHEIPD